MSKFLSFIKEFKIPKKEELNLALKSLSRREFLIVITSTIIALFTLIILLIHINNAFLVEIPADGGTITEGIIGMPTLVNPVLAISDADHDLTTLVYSGLMRKMPDGTFIPDLASDYTISPDGLTYTFNIKPNAKFQDGTQVTADDIVFTIQKIKDSLLKSPRKINWEGIEVSKKDELTVIFTLKQPYISFMDNATIGILPAHIWQNLSPAEFSLSGLNIKAIGSGPYQIDSISKNSDGIPNSYILKRFSNFTLGEPHIKYVNIISYANEKDLIDALLYHSIDQAGGLSPENMDKVKKAGYTIHTSVLPRMFGLFFNSTNNKIFADKNVIQAFNVALDRTSIVKQVLAGYGTVIESPIPEIIIKNTDPATITSIDNAKQILDNAGWIVGQDGIRSKGGTSKVVTTKKVKGKIIKTTKSVSNGPIIKLSFSISTGGDPELNQTAVAIKQQLESIGASVIIKNYETGPLNQLIRSRNYEALFFGQVVNHESDLYAFWDSSQRTDPGLNIAMYSNTKADLLLEQAQKLLDQNQRIKEYQQFAQLWKYDMPALFIYSPEYLYALKPSINNLTFTTITVPADRFLTIYKWYADTDHVWKIFTNSPASGIKK